MGLFTRRVAAAHWSLWDRYGVAFAILATATLIEHWLMPSPHRAPFVFFYLAIVTCSLFFDLITALFAVLLSAFILTFFFMEPLRSILVWSEDERFALLVFVLIGVATSGLIELLHRGVARLLPPNDRL